MSNITIREYAYLRVSQNPPQQNQKMDFAEISQSGFDYLFQLNQELLRNGQRILKLGRTASEIQVQNFVGVIETPCGTEIEILPKHADSVEDNGNARAILIKILKQVLQLPQRDTGLASIEKFKVPLTDWFYAQFLDALQKLYRTGIRFDYQRVEAEENFLRGQLDTAQQMRKLLTRQHQLSIKHDIFTSNRAENRLIRSCIDVVCKRAKTADLWRTSHEFHLLFSEVPQSTNYREDFKKWKNDRLMSHYSDIRYWCELILGNEIPFAVKGINQAKSILFPMEKLFEKYVEIQLSKQLVKGAKLETQKSSKYLAQYNSKDIFNLIPDLAIQYYCEQSKSKKYLILDTKWKLINSNNIEEKFGIKQSDMYQMFAYNHMYQGHTSDIVLIYPKHKNFQIALKPFEFKLHDLLKTGLQPKIWVIPFDLERSELILDNLMIAGLHS